MESSNNPDTPPAGKSPSVGIRGRLSRLVGGMGGVVNFTVAAAVLVWLAATIAFLHDFPLWIVLTVAAVALAAGIAHRSQFRRRVIVVAVCGVAGVGAASYFFTRPGTDDATHARAASPVPVVAGLQASLEVRNQTLGGVWGRTIEADGSDELQFRLVVENPTATPSSSVVVRVLARENTEEPREIDICFARTESGAMEEGPIVKVVPQSNGLGKFTSWRPQIGFPSPLATRLISLGGEEWTTQGSEFRAQDYTVPALSAHQRMVITFAGSFQVPDSGQIGGGSLDLKNLTEHQAEYESVTSARPGDVIQADYVVHNSGFRSVDTFARVHIAGHHEGLVDRISVFMRENNGPEHEHGYGLVNASGSEPVGLSVIPGTTELRTPETECSKAGGRPLPDGVTEGGVELGSIGAFEPHDPCHSSELTRALFFKLRVDAAK